MKKLITAIAITAALAAAATYQYLQTTTDHHQSALQSRLHVVEQALSATQQELLGYTIFTQYGGHQKSHLRPDEIPGRHHRFGPLPLGPR
ncbi:MAG: hypothetical protein CRU72_00275 [Candidatus Accumulibacter phosphatis]|nr:hypothetical protein [Candidatus Accumulibacter phosphatis]